MPRLATKVRIELGPKEEAVAKVKEEMSLSSWKQRVARRSSRDERRMAEAAQQLRHKRRQVSEWEEVRRLLDRHRESIANFGTIRQRNFTAIWQLVNKERPHRPHPPNHYYKKRTNAN